MPTFERSLDISLPQRKIWDYITDFSHWEKFLTVTTFTSVTTNSAAHSGQMMRASIAHAGKARAGMPPLTAHEP